MYRIVYYEEDRADDRQVDVISAENKTSVTRTVAAVRELLLRTVDATKRPLILITPANDEDKK